MKRKISRSSTKRKSPKVKKVIKNVKVVNKKLDNEMKDMLDYSMNMIKSLKNTRRLIKASQTVKDGSSIMFYIYTLRGCRYCEMAKDLLKRKYQPYETYEFSTLSSEEQSKIQSIIKVNNKGKAYEYFPKIFFNNKFIGGYDDLTKFLGKT